MSVYVCKGWFVQDGAGKGRMDLASSTFWKLPINLIPVFHWVEKLLQRTTECTFISSRETTLRDEEQGWPYICVVWYVIEVTTKPLQEASLYIFSSQIVKA